MMGRMPDTDALNSAYRERAHLVALLSRLFPSQWWTDPAEPDWPIVYITTPEGQLSWHVSREDADLFANVTAVATENPWDGHDTAEKYRRLDRLCRGSGWMVMRALYQSTPALVAPAMADQHAPVVYNMTV
jgi:hypothetical protein